MNYTTIIIWKNKMVPDSQLECWPTNLSI